MNPDVSVIIPTLGRTSRLHATLQALAGLDRATPEFEVVVVFDGCDPNGAAPTVTLPFRVTVLAQAHRGPGPARNLGAAAARGRYLLFLNDDTRPAADCLLAHHRAQTKFGPAAVLGRTEWDPESQVTRYMEWLAPNGHQFNFSRMTAGGQIPWTSCWSTNLSVPREWLKEHPFDPGFPFPALEDGEWAYRIARSSHALRHAPEAVCFHDHRYEGPGDFRLRARLAGAAARYVARRHPSLFWAVLMRPAAAAIVRTGSFLLPRPWDRRLVWDLDYRWNYVLGMLSPQSGYRFPVNR
jgi:GT2 family glycosyltransferase